MKILLDMNLPRKWEAYFRDHGIEALHWSTIGPNDATDVKILEFAAREGYAIFTRDLDFGYLLANSGAALPSVILARMQDIRPGQIGATIVSAIDRFAGELDSGCLLSIGENKQRVRILPFR